MKKVLIIISIFATCFILPSCDNADNAKEGPDQNKDAQKCQPVEYNNGVYYFPCIKKDFGTSLSSFLQVLDSSLELKAITANGTGTYGFDMGYFIVIGKK